MLIASGILAQDGISGQGDAWGLIAFAVIGVAILIAVVKAFRRPRRDDDE